MDHRTAPAMDQRQADINVVCRAARRSCNNDHHAKASPTVTTLQVRMTATVNSNSPATSRNRDNHRNYHLSHTLNHDLGSRNFDASSAHLACGCPVKPVQASSCLTVYATFQIEKVSLSGISCRVRKTRAVMQPCVKRLVRAIEQRVRSVSLQPLTFHGPDCVGEVR